MTPAKAAYRTLWEARFSPEAMRAFFKADAVVNNSSMGCRRFSQCGIALGGKRDEG